MNHLAIAPSEGPTGRNVEPAASPRRIGAGLTALVVDDEPTNRLVLKAHLSRLGFEVVEASDGEQAVEAFVASPTDFVFMDVMMPGIDGLEAARRIRSAAGTTYFPLVFLTALNDEDSVVRCLEAGGDECLSKPYSLQVLRGKIHALNRTRMLHVSLAELSGRLQRDEEIAEKVFQGAVTSTNLINDSIQTLLQPASTFSGDVALSARSPSGDVHILLGDFTGHGLSAALGALPISETFRAMTSKGFGIQEILAGINRKLAQLLPTGMFMAAHCVSVGASLNRVTVVNCGMPDVLVLRPDGALDQRIESGSFALGIDPGFNAHNVSVNVAIEPGMRLVLASDGLHESTDASGEQFSNRRIEEAIDAARGEPWLLPTLTRSLAGFCGDAEQHDDVSIVELRCDETLLQPGEEEASSGTTTMGRCTTPDAIWHTSLRLCGSRLRQTDPVPMLMSQLLELEGIAEHRASLHTVLTELYVNALDHGVLELDSSLKNGSNGFLKYMENRTERLERLTDGFVDISLRIEPADDARRIAIRVADSGSGFDLERAFTADTNLLHGRGLRLVRQLCESISHEPDGNVVEAVYLWRRGGPS